MRNKKKSWLFRTLLLMLVLLAMPVSASAAVRINKKTFTLIAGESTQLKLKGLSGTESLIEWQVKRANVADIAPNGKNAKVTAKAKGSTYIYAVVDGTQYRCKLKVTEPAAAIRLNRSKKSLKKGKSYRLKATIESETNENVQISWKSSNKKVARVDSKGKVTAVGPGTAKITAYTKKKNAINATCKITVKGDPVKLSTTQLNLTAGQKANLKVTSDSGSATYTWSSSDKTVATVTKKGKVKAKKAGTAVITVKRSSDGASATCEVSVLDVVAQGNASAKAMEFLAILQKYSQQVKTDKAAGIKWMYAVNSGQKVYSTWDQTITKSRKSKKAYLSCVQLSQWALRELNIIGSGNFRGNMRGSAEWKADGDFTIRDKDQLLQHCVIIKVDKTVGQLIKEGTLLPGDICSHANYRHTNVYAGNGTWYDSGRGGDCTSVDGNYVFNSFGPQKRGDSSDMISSIVRILK